MARASLRACLAALACAGIGACSASSPLPSLVPQNVTFNKHVAPILFANCVQCHRPGEAAPFSLLTYADAREHAKEIGEQTMARHMPPWLPEKGEFALVGERRLKPEQIDTLQRWIQTGMVEGDAADRPAAPVFPDGWQTGKPDLVVSVDKPYVVPASRDDIYRNLVVRVPLTATSFVRAVEFKTNGAPIHHAVIRVDRTSASRRKDGADGQPGFDGMSQQSVQDPGGQFIGWAPGRGPIVSPEGMPWRLDRGADLVIELHLVPQPRPVPVHPTVALYFTDTPPVRNPLHVKMGTKAIDIPAGERNFVVRETYDLPVNIELMGVYPHAHYLGKEMRLEAALPGGATKELMFIKQWSFHWQQDYRYVTPIALPRGTRLTMTYTYDNSEANAMNPSTPPVRVKLGPRSVDEMGEMGLQVLAASPADAEQLLRYFDEHDTQSTIVAAERRAREEPNVAQHQAFLGAAYVMAGRPADALAPLQAALKIDDKLATAHSDLGTALMSLRRIDEALVHLRRAAALAPKDEKMFFNLGNALNAASKFTDAASAYQRSIALNDEYADAHANLGALLMSRGQPKAALPYFERAAALEPDSAQSQTDLSSALAANGRFADAMMRVKRALAIDPSYAPALENQRRLQQLGIR